MATQAGIANLFCEEEERSWIALYRMHNSDESIRHTMMGTAIRRQLPLRFDTISFLFLSAIHEISTNVAPCPVRLVVARWGTLSCHSTNLIAQ